MSSIDFNRKQVEFLMLKTGADTPQEALEIFAKAIQAERVDPSKMLAYLNKLMEKENK